ncbi:MULTISPECIES: hypothetical protein [Bombella]|uniref:Transporter n=1 Tax=Bombella pollinis TaxID=2967337 RepID=A0ABT3WJ83_9PROT|nr:MULTISPECIES: hypothetical protein [Bombella]MCX5619162.1 hypothetical protein [Bombella pollinis]
MKKSVRYAALLSSLVAGTYGATAQLYAADAAGTNSVSTMSDDKAKVKSVKKADKTASTSTPTVATQAATPKPPVVQVAEKPASKPLPEQWYTGSLYSPSPALPAPGMIAVEPYVAAGLPAGAFDSNGHLNTRKGAGGQHSISQFSLAKYGITDHLSLYLLPTYSYSWGDHQKHSGLKFNDLPVEFQYRLTPHYTPSITLYFGVNTPTGDYKNLSNASEGVGQGVWALRYGVHSQFALPFFKHAMRVRLWAQVRHPVASTKLRNITSYGTEKGFTGRGHAGPYGNEGGSVELGITKKWVFALDLYHVWSTSNSVNGYNRYTNKNIHYRTGWSGAFNVGPGIEYNWTSSIGGIVGVILPVAGHNTSRSISPQVAVFAVF